jgi:hypothetical protein
MLALDPCIYNHFIGWRCGAIIFFIKNEQLNERRRKTIASPD